MAGRKRKSKDRSSAARGLKKLRAEKDDDDRRPKSQVRGSKIDAETEKASWKSKQEKWTGSKKTSGGREIDIWRQKLNAGGKSWALLPRGAWENPKPGAWKTKTGAGPQDARRKLDSRRRGSQAGIEKNDRRPTEATGPGAQRIRSWKRLQMKIFFMGNERRGYTCRAKSEEPTCMLYSATTTTNK
jgi:hypothetical protein